MLKKLKFSILILCGVAYATPQTTTQNLFTTAKNNKAFSVMVDNLNNEEQDIFILGKSFFRVPWVESPSATTARDGLGPLFNANTCTSCHPKNGLSSLYNKNGEVSRGYTSKLSNIHNYDKNYGEQIAINGNYKVKYEAKQIITYENIVEKYPSGEEVILKKPKVGVEFQLKDLQYGKLQKDTYVSNRLAPALIGMGLIEQISVEDILANEDIEDKNGDGISGKANIVFSKVSNSYELGRFNAKAGIATLKEQIANAAQIDMGITTSLYPNDNCTQTQKECLNAPKSDTLRSGTLFDLPDERLDAITYYLSNLKVPKREITQKNGEKLFSQIGCTRCHVSSYNLPSGLTIDPFSDFLLHDMGYELGDNRVEFKASKNEFRTKPLWGIGLYSIVLGDTANYLHDGRAKSIEEAILWHNGEAKNVKNSFKNLSQNEREDIISYLKEL